MSEKRVLRLRIPFIPARWRGLFLGLTLTPLGVLTIYLQYLWVQMLSSWYADRFDGVLHAIILHGWMALIAVIGLYTACIIAHEHTKSGILLGFGIVIFIPYLAFLYWGMGYLCYNGYLYCRDAAWPLIQHYRLDMLLWALLSVASILISYWIYKVRCYARFIYGHVEIVVGTIGLIVSIYSGVVAAFAAAPPPPGANQGLILPFLAGAYVIVRGLTNIEDAIKDKPLETIKNETITLGKYIAYARGWGRRTFMEEVVVDAPPVPAG